MLRHEPPGGRQIFSPLLTFNFRSVLRRTRLDFSDEQSPKTYHSESKTMKSIEMFIVSFESDKQSFEFVNPCESTLNAGEAVSVNFFR